MKKSENNSPDLCIGDLVYVDAYGPFTYGFSDGGGEMKSDKPFRPKVYKFTANLQYMVTYVEGDSVTLFDDDNNIVDLNRSRLNKNIPLN